MEARKYRNAKICIKGGDFASEISQIRKEIFYMNSSPCLELIFYRGAP